MEWNLLAMGYDNYTNYIKLPQSILVEFNQPENFNDFDNSIEIKVSKNKKKKSINLKNELEKIPTERIKPPYYFCIESSVGTFSYCGVQDFTADEGLVIIPNHLLDQMIINGSDFVTVRYVSNVPKGKFVLIEPLDKEIFNIYDLDKFLEKILSGYCILYQNQIINFEYNNNIYKILIKETKSVNDIEANLIDVVNTDLSIDIYNKFLEEELKQKKEQERLDKERQEKEKIEKEKQLKIDSTKSMNQYFTGEGKRLGGETIQDPILMRELRLQKFIEINNQNKEAYAMKQIEKSIMDLALWESQPVSKHEHTKFQTQTQTQQPNQIKKPKEFDL